MQSPEWLAHWAERRTTTTFYQVTDLLNDGHRARVPAQQITATVSGWLAELGVQSPLVDDLAGAVRSGDWATAHNLADRLSIDISVAG